MENSQQFVPKLICYRSLKSKDGMMSGGCVHYQFSLDDVDLWHAKMKSPRPKDPVPIGKNSEAHYSNPEYLLAPSNDFSDFVLKNAEGKELMKVHFSLMSGKGSPKEIDAKWFGEDGTTMELKNKLPEKTDDGAWSLDFDGRYAVPSIKNAIMVNPTNQEIQCMVRRLDKREMNVDAKREIPSLFLFGLAICLNICPF